jgi:hypothetical protein
MLLLAVVHPFRGTQIVTATEQGRAPYVGEKGSTSAWGIVQG